MRRRRSQGAVVVAVEDRRYSVVLLAAGESRRMDGANKLHLPVFDEPLLRHNAKTWLATQAREIVVVLGHQRDATLALLDGLALRCVDNEDYRSGQMTSVHCGLAALQAPCEAVFVALGDQPALEVDDIERLAEAFFSRDGGEVVIPEYRGQRGNPIVISDSCRRQIGGSDYNFGCRRFIENHPQLVRRVEMPRPSVIIDLDTPQDYHEFRARHEHSKPLQQVN